MPFENRHTVLPPTDNFNIAITADGITQNCTICGLYALRAGNGQYYIHFVGLNEDKQSPPMDPTFPNPISPGFYLHMLRTADGDKGECFSIDGSITSLDDGRYNCTFSSSQEESGTFKLFIKELESGEVTISGTTSKMPEAVNFSVTGKLEILSEGEDLASALEYGALGWKK